jgi:hypothetical protein
MRSFTAIAIASVFFSTSLPAQVVRSVLGASEEQVEGELNWTERTLTVYGEGVAPSDMTNVAQRRLMGFRAARTVAYRNLLDIVGEVHVDSRTTVSMAMVTSESIRTVVEDVVRGARVVQGSQQEVDGFFRLALRIPLSGDFALVLLPESGDPAGLPPTVLPASDSLLIFVPAEPYTGLIVDVRGLDLRPTMSPRIVDTTDRVIYSAEQVDRSYAVDMGVVGYDKDIQRAAEDDRMGGKDAHPLIVEAEAVSGLFNGDVVLGEDSGIRVRMADIEGDFLSRCRVTFILGAKPPPVRAAFLDSALADSNAAFLDSALADSNEVAEFADEDSHRH